MKKITIIIVLILSIKAFSQTKYSKSITSFGLPINNDSMIYTTYPDNFLIGIESSSYENCKNEFPEQTLMSIISASNYEWDKKNYNYDITNKVTLYEIEKQF
ncbi:hypothetical protein IUY40_00050 [Flavobacterium sp. ALJ2]|uniref:hypothetical protein n=1 Tax=Flavobacterium sp. ALJ2 TaxID=2786960 RepID=UPI00189ECF86|nr:hypothetical protein [Flavobacterium sp. ALJ2]MBF7089941.1 hypothetical protein [Flavobacterium sp. ALJ2]